MKSLLVVLVLAGSLPSLAHGHAQLSSPQYSVSWRALAADAHVMTGTFTFTIDAANRSSQVDHAGADASVGHTEHAQH